MTYHYHKKDGNQRVIITLHGTGADEHDLDQVAEAIDDEATLYGLRGDVNENGMLRWFRRKAPGVFDESDIHMRARQLADWLRTLAREENFSLEDALFVGFSNGANMIAALLQLYPSSVTNAAILHGQVPLPEEDFPAFSKANVFLSAGVQDRLITYQQSKELEERLKHSGANVEFFSHQGGHQITREELDALRSFWTGLTPS